MSDTELIYIKLVSVLTNLCGCPNTRLQSFDSSLSRVVYAFGPRITTSVNEITVTYLREPVIGTLREVDARVNAVLLQEGCMRRLSQMPIVLIPIHFDRDPGNMMASSSILRSVVLRPFLTADFMTGLPARPGVDLPLAVSPSHLKSFFVIV